MMNKNEPVDISLPALKAAVESWGKEASVEDLAGQRMLADFNRMFSLVEEGQKKVVYG